MNLKGKFFKLHTNQQTSIFGAGEIIDSSDTACLVRLDAKEGTTMPCVPLEIIPFEAIDLVFDSREDLDVWIAWEPEPKMSVVRALRPKGGK